MSERVGHDIEIVFIDELLVISRDMTGLCRQSSLSHFPPPGFRAATFLPVSFRIDEHDGLGERETTRSQFWVLDAGFVTGCKHRKLPSLSIYINCYTLFVSGVILWLAVSPAQAHRRSQQEGAVGIWVSSYTKQVCIFQTVLAYRQFCVFFAKSTGLSSLID